MTLTLTRAEEITGSLSDPSKMPAWSYGLPAKECKTGEKLKQVEGSVCANCYAEQKSSNYIRFKKNVEPAQYKRLASIEDPEWVSAMVVFIGKRAAKTPWFRWHDSGDLQSVAHLRKIVAVAVHLPEVHFWLPTREYAFVREYLATGAVFPKNLVVRLSAHMIDGPAPVGYGLPVSTVHTENVPEGASECVARYQNDECRQCRACWDSRVRWVSYHEH